ncbi:31969_t:CDS:2, partial [Gigaspora margarita]
MDIQHVELGKKDCEGLKCGANKDNNYKKKNKSRRKRVLNDSMDDSKHKISKTSYKSNKIENRRLTECKEALDAACSTWLQKVEMFRSRICESKSKESLLERKDKVNIKNREIRNDQTRNNNIAQLVEIGMNANIKGSRVKGIRGDDLDRFESAISLGDDVEPKKLIDSDKKRIDESNKKKVIINLITRKKICQTNTQEMKYLPESDEKEVLIESANKKSNGKNGLKHDFEMIAKADDTNKEAEKDKDVVDNNVDESANIKNDEENEMRRMLIKIKGESAKGSIDTCSCDVAVGNILGVNVVMYSIE